MDKHEIFMRKALEEARLAEEEGEIPVGAVVVCKGRVIARAHNQTERLNDVTARASCVAVRLLGPNWENWCTGLLIRIGGMPGFPRLCCTRRQTWLPEF